MRNFMICKSTLALSLIIVTGHAIGYASVPLTVTAHKNEIIVSPGDATANGRTLTLKTSATLAIAPADIISVHDEKSNFPATMPHMWQGGNLRQVRTANAIPGSFIPGSLKIRLEDGTLLQRDKDYIVDDTWASVACTPGGRMTTVTPVLVDYDYSKMRLDGIDINPGGTVLLVPGTPHLVCPEPPPVTSGSIRLANIFRPYNSTSVEPWQIFTIGEPFPEPAYAEQVEMSKPVQKTLEKLRSGKAVTIVTWGDSVTVGGDTSKPELAFANLFISRLRERFPKADITHINAGIGGSTTNDRLPGLDADVLAHKPDLVTIEFVNDMALTSATLTDNWNNAITRIKSAGAEAIVITPHFTASFIAMHPHPRGSENRPNVELMKEIAAQQGVALADTSRRWSHLEHEGIPYITLLYNGINHPNDYGHELFVKDLMNLFPVMK